MAGRLSGLRSKIRDIQNGEGDRGFLWKIVAGVGYLVVHTWAGEVVRGRAAVGCREVPSARPSRVTAGMMIGGYAASFRCVDVDEAALSWRAKFRTKG